MYQYISIEITHKIYIFILCTMYVYKCINM